MCGRYLQYYYKHRYDIPSSKYIVVINENNNQNLYRNLLFDQKKKREKYLNNICN